MKNLLSILLFTTLAIPAFACQMHKDQSIIKSQLDKPDATCGKMLYFDFGSAADAPAYYTDLKGNVISECGGNPQTSDNDAPMDTCPPKGWTCAEPPAQTENKHLAPSKK